MDQPLKLSGRLGRAATSPTLIDDAPPVHVTKLAAAHHPTAPHHHHDRSVPQEVDKSESEFHRTDSHAHHPKLHLVPFSFVAYSGPARVSSYFVIERAATDENVLEATFRGRELRGCRVEVPAGYRGE
jgi:hypothetical protein